MSLLFLVFVRWTIKLLSDLVHLFFFLICCFQYHVFYFFFSLVEATSTRVQEGTHIYVDTQQATLFIFFFLPSDKREKGEHLMRFSLFVVAAGTSACAFCVVEHRLGMQDTPTDTRRSSLDYVVCFHYFLFFFFFLAFSVFCYCCLLWFSCIFVSPPLFFLERGGVAFVVIALWGDVEVVSLFFPFADASDGCTRRGKQQWAAAFSISQCRLLFSFFFFFFFGLIIVIKGA